MAVKKENSVNKSAIKSQPKAKSTSKIVEEASLNSQKESKVISTPPKKMEVKQRILTAEGVKRRALKQTTKKEEK